MKQSKRRESLAEWQARQIREQAEQHEARRRELSQDLMQALHRDEQEEEYEQFAKDMGVDY